jgi:hypothetical protein
LKARAREGKKRPVDCLVTRTQEKRSWATREKRKDRVVGLGWKREERKRRGICFFSNSFSTFQTFKFKLFKTFSTFKLFSKFKHFKPFSKFSKQFKNF